MSVEYEKMYDWAILPSKTFVSFTAEKPCITLKNPRLIRLYPDKINHIFLGFQIKIPYGFIFKIQSPVKKQNWRILSDYLMAPVLENLQVSVPVITNCETFIHPGEVIAHLQLYPICFICAASTGKTV